MQRKERCQPLEWDHLRGAVFVKESAIDRKTCQIATSFCVLYRGMGRCLRFIPPGGAMVEVTARTVQGRPLLTPSAEMNQIILGALARAQELYPLEINSFAFLSGHYHLGLWVEDAQQLSKFMCHFNSNLAREICRLRGWTDKVWSRRYSAIVVSDEPEAQRQRFAYIMSQSVKEGLVAAVKEWPGVHVVHHLLGDQPAEGFWFDRTRSSAPIESTT